MSRRVWLSRLDRLLAGPPPVPRPTWTLTAVVETPFPRDGGPRESHVDGLRLWYQGPPVWSECHHHYRVDLDRVLRKRLATDPPGVVVEIANRLGLWTYQLKATVGFHDWPRCPEGLCYSCWTSGRRTAGRIYLRSEAPVADGTVRTSQLHICDAHCETMESREQLTAVPV